MYYKLRTFRPEGEKETRIYSDLEWGLTRVECSVERRDGSGYGWTWIHCECGCYQSHGNPIEWDTRGYTRSSQGFVDNVLGPCRPECPASAADL